MLRFHFVVDTNFKQMILFFFFFLEGLKSKVSHMSPTPWCGHCFKHAHNHITRAILYNYNYNNNNNNNNLDHPPRKGAAIEKVPGIK